MNEISVIDGKRVWIYQRDSLGNNSAKLEEQKQKMLELAEHHGFEVVGCTIQIHFPFPKQGRRAFDIYLLSVLWIIRTVLRRK